MQILVRPAREESLQVEDDAAGESGVHVSV